MKYQPKDNKSLDGAAVAKLSLRSKVICLPSSPCAIRCRALDNLRSNSRNRAGTLTRICMGTSSNCSACITREVPCHPSYLQQCSCWRKQDSSTHETGLLQVVALSLFRLGVYPVFWIYPGNHDEWLRRTTSHPGYRHRRLLQGDHWIWNWTSSSSSFPFSLRHSPVGLPPDGLPPPVVLDQRLLLGQRLLPLMPLPLPAGLGHRILPLNPLLLPL